MNDGENFLAVSPCIALGYELDESLPVLRCRVYLDLICVELQTVRGVGQEETSCSFCSFT